jgi:hypothetical protein
MKNLIYNQKNGMPISIYSGCVVSTEFGGNTVSLEVEDDVKDISKIRIVNGQIVPLPERPSQYHQFNYETGEWADTRDTAFYEAEARAKRQQLLAASDWTQLPDVPLATKAAWATYRQALRNITEQAGFPLGIVWPTPPSN